LLKIKLGIIHNYAKYLLSLKSIRFYLDVNSVFGNFEIAKSENLKISTLENDHLFGIMTILPLHCK